MDLFKTIKGLKAYSNDLGQLYGSITAVLGTKVKIGKYKIIETPSKELAKRLREKLCDAVKEELDEITMLHEKAERILDEIQMDLFKTEEEANQ